MSVHKRIVVKLSPRSIDAAMREVETLRREAESTRSARLRSIAEAVRDRAEQYYNAAWVDDIAGGTRRAAEVAVTVETTPRGYKVVASGVDAVFVEFGAGVYHNGAVGASPHPKGAELGFTIGSYGKGRGKGRAWGFYGDGGELVITHGTPAQMPLYRAFRDVIDEVMNRD
jgi:hypothetical protein